MANIISTQSGNWSATATWAGGVAPAAGDDVTISAGHSVILDAAFTAEKSLTVNGKLSLAASLQTGNSTGKDCAFTLNPGAELEISAAGTWLTGNGVYTLKGTADNWARLSGAGTMNITTSPSSPKLRWDCRHLSVTMTGAVMFNVQGTHGGAAIDPALIFDHCVFEGYASLGMGRGGYTPATTPISITNCDFRGAGVVTVSRILSNGPAVIFENNTTYSQTVRSGVRFFVGGPVVVWKDCVAVNHGANGSYSSALPLAAEGGAHLNDVTSTPALFYSGSAEGGYITGALLANANSAPANFNPHLVTTPRVEDCVIEMFGSEPNAHIIAVSYKKAESRRNLMIGVGDLFNLVGDYALDADIANNTVVRFDTGSTGGLALMENGSNTPPSYGLKCRNNLHGSLSESGAATYMLRVVGGSAPLYADSDYNANFNVTQPYHDRVINSSAAEHDIVGDPQFTDPSRRVAGWAASVGLSGTYEAARDCFLAMNGYDADTKTQKAANIPAYGWQDCVNWLRAGFTPRNTALASAGEGGTYIGAIPPSAGPNPPEPEYALTLAALPSALAPGATSQFTATLTDNGNPVAGQRVNFSKVSGTGGGAFSPAYANTDANGQARSTFTAGALGTLTARAVLNADASVYAERTITVRDTPPAPTPGELAWHTPEWR